MDISNNSIFNIDNISDMLLKYFKLNYIFYIGLIIIFFVYSRVLKQNFIKNILSFILFSFFGYFIHLYSHLHNYEELIEKLIKHKIYFTRCAFGKSIFRKLGKFMNFHNDIHHDSDINKSFKNQIYEFLNNFIAQGLYVFILILIAKSLNYWMALIWGLFYATFHIINYTVIKQKVHEQHHENSNTNYGIDVWDIIFNTKKNEELEVFNNTLINIIIILGIIILINILLKKKSAY